MTQDEIRNILETGKIVKVKFIKKDGTERIIIGRSGVKKGTKGIGLPYDKYDKGIIILNDFNLLRKGMASEKAFRAIKIDSIISVQYENKSYSFE